VADQVIEREVLSIVPITSAIVHHVEKRLTNAPCPRVCLELTSSPWAEVSTCAYALMCSDESRYRCRYTRWHKHGLVEFDEQRVPAGLVGTVTKSLGGG
jgi:hypothetical protein